MAVPSLITALCNFILLLSLIISSLAARIPSNIPESDLPFEFNHEKGSEIVGQNVLTQSVSSDGKTVMDFNRNSPQPIKKYHHDKKSTDQLTNQPNNKEIQTNNQNINKKPQNSQVKTNRNKPNNYATYISPQDMNQLDFLENINKYFPGMRSNIRVIYI